MEHELRVWLAMPGFTLKYHVETLDHPAHVVKHFMGHYEDLKSDVCDNWLSATREDCIKLGNRRPSKGDLPFLTKFQMLKDSARGLSQKQIAEDFGVAHSTAHRHCQWVPDDAYFLPAELVTIVEEDPIFLPKSRSPRIPFPPRGASIPVRPPISQEDTDRVCALLRESAHMLGEAAPKPSVDPVRMKELLDGSLKYWQAEKVPEPRPVVPPEALLSSRCSFVPLPSEKEMQRELSDMLRIKYADRIAAFFPKAAS